MDILYKDKERIFENLDFINTILSKKIRTDPKYLDYIGYVEEAKQRLKANGNFDMSLDNLILKIWEIDK